MFKKKKNYLKRKRIKVEFNDDLISLPELWVQGGLVKARILRPDLSGTNGKIHLIDSVLGVPYLDLPNVICSDLWLL